MAAATLEDTARSLAQAHRKADPETESVYWSVDPKGEEVRLVEVSSGVAPVHEVFPFRFAAVPNKGINHPSVVVLLHPDEWTELNEGKLHLPDSWQSPKDLTELR